MLDMRRNIILRLCGYCKKNRKGKLQAIFGMCEEIYDWRDHYMFNKMINYSFKIKHGNKFAFGKKNEDVDKVSVNDLVIRLYFSLTEDSEIKISKGDIVEFEFGVYSGVNISRWFLSYCVYLTTPPTIPSSVTSIGLFFLYK